MRRRCRLSWVSAIRPHPIRRDGCAIFLERLSFFLLRQKHTFIMVHFNVAITIKYFSHGVLPKYKPRVYYAFTCIDEKA